MGSLSSSRLWINGLTAFIKEKIGENMQVTVSEEKKEREKWVYPCLVINDNNMIILAFSDHGDKPDLMFDGILINNNLESEGWNKTNMEGGNFNKEDFRLYKGTVRLKND
jgi:hypothetical protein